MTFSYGSAGANAGPYAAVSSNQALVAGEWSHVVVTRNMTAGIVRWFINGVETNSAATTRTPSASSLPLLIGGGYTNRYAGQMDEVAVYTSALSAGQVATHCNALVGGTLVDYGNAVSADSPDSRWQLDETAGGIAFAEAGSVNGSYSGGILLGQPGTVDVEMPRDRNASFEPQRIPKH